MIAVVGHCYRFGESFSLIVHSTGADRINVAPIVFALPVKQSEIRSQPDPGRR
jgi:hypothetical protein